MFAKWVFGIAGLYGLLVLIPLVFAEASFAVPPATALARPEFFYGFAGVALAFQLVFLIIATDPSRYRPLMLAGVIEKIAGGALLLLWLQGRGLDRLAVGGAIDLLLGALFLVSYLRTPRYRVRI